MRPDNWILFHFLHINRFRVIKRLRYWAYKLGLAVHTESMNPKNMKKALPTPAFQNPFLT